MNDTSSHISWKQLASLDHDTQSWKMSEDISASDSKKFLKGLPKLGMMQNGVLFELVMSEHHTNEHDCSSLLNLPTPTASEHIWENCKPRKGVKGNHNLSLANAVQLLPTPLANDAKISYVARNQVSLSKVLLATPNTLIGRTTGRCRNWGADLLHDVKCECKDRRTHWI